jgi:hypothetical protein
MAGLNKIEDYLIALGIAYEEPQPGTFLIEDPGRGLPGVFVSFADPVVIIRAHVMDAPKARREDFFEELLKLNNEGLTHGAYALEGNKVVVVDSLEYAEMDKGEFEASLDAIGFALSEHYPILSRYKGD